MKYNSIYCPFISTCRCWNYPPVHAGNALVKNVHAGKITSFAQTHATVRRENLDSSEDFGESEYEDNDLYYDSEVESL